MSLESASFIHQLLPSNPTTQDKMKQGDDHIRQLKQVLQNNFPGLTGAVTVSEEVLNQVPPNLTAIILGLASHGMQKGAIIAHDPSQVIPGGWVVADGRTVAGYGVVPDLRGRFIKGASVSEEPGTIGGAASGVTNASAAHTHSGTTGEHILTEGEIPSHSHVLSQNILTEGVPGSGLGGATSGSSAPIPTTGNVGSDQGHSHTISADGAHSHTVATQPPYYTLVYIVKTTEFVMP
jgi:hypothetical protein